MCEKEKETGGALGVGEGAEGRQGRYGQSKCKRGHVSVLM